MSPVRNLKKTPVAVRIAVVVGGLVLLAAAGYFLLIVPKKNEAKSLTRQIVQINAQISEQTSQATQAAGLSKILIANYNKLQTAMPNEARMDEVYQQLYALAKDTGIRFDSYQPGTVVDTSAYQVLPLTVTFEGSFDKLSDFLYRLQSLVLVDNHRLIASGRLFTVDQVAYAEGENGFPQISATLVIDAYAFGHPVVTATSPAASTTPPAGTTSTSTTGTTTSSSSGGTPTSATGGGGS